MLYTDSTMFLVGRIPRRIVCGSPSNNGDTPTYTDIRPYQGECVSDLASRMPVSEQDHGEKAGKKGPSIIGERCCPMISLTMLLSEARQFARQSRGSYCPVC